MKAAGVSVDSIKKSFSVPAQMTVFSWKGDIDTIMTPMDSIKYYKSFLRTGLMSIEPTTGFVKAYVGNINMKHFKYDNAKIGKNQVGSTFKPFLYALAMKEGYTPCSKVLVVPQTFKVNDSIWIPRSTCKPEDLNTYKTLKWGLANSENYVSAWLLKQFNPESIVELAHKIGIESPVEAVPSMIYGVSNMSVYEMVSAYCTFANKGVHIKPIMVTRIEDKNGNVLAKFMPEKEDAINENTAYLMINLMRGVIDGGTAGRLRSQYQFTAPIAGKTGTTNDFSDGWFIGIVPKLVTGIWVGGEERPVRFDSWLGQGASMAMPIWAYYMQRVYKDPSLGITESDQFEVPQNFNADLNCTEGLDDENGYEEYNYEQYNYLKEDYGGD
jgi:penicillin-binding protein 1A